MVFDSFNEPVKPIFNLTKLPHNLPFGLSVVHNSTVCKIFRNTAHCSTVDGKMQSWLKSINRRFVDSRYLFFTAGLVYRIDVPFLSFIRVYFV